MFETFALSRIGWRLKRWPLIGHHIRHIRRYHYADILLVSFPKCGRTWLRVLLGKAIQQHFGLPQEMLLTLTKMGQFDPAIPSIKPVHRSFFTKKRGASLRQLERLKVILLIRDPRDVVVSRYFQLTRRKRKIKFKGTLADFVYASERSFESFLAYYHHWAEARHVPKSLLLVRYEDMHAQPEQQLAQILAFCGLSQISQETIAEAVAFAAFDNMKRLEATGYFQSVILKPGNISDSKSFKTRRGKTGGYVDYLAEQEINYMTRRIQEELDPFYGYTTAH